MKYKFCILAPTSRNNNWQLDCLVLRSEVQSDIRAQFE